MTSTLTIDWIAFGESIGAARKRLRMNQAELATIIGISRNYLSMIEVGRQNVSYEIVAALCVYLQIKFPTIRVGT